MAGNAHRHQRDGQHIGIELVKVPYGLLKVLGIIIPGAEDTWQCIRIFVLFKEGDLFEDVRRLGFPAG